MEYEVANGVQVPNLGEREIAGVAEDGVVADIQTLMSVSKFTRAGNRIVFDDGFTLFERAMDDRSVLNVDSLSYVDGSNVSPDDGLKPTG